MKFNYIFDKSYSQALEKLTEFFDETKSWDLVSKITFGPDDCIVRELLVKNCLENLDNKIVKQLFEDIKFMEVFVSPEERDAQFKQHFCSTRLFDLFFCGSTVITRTIGFTSSLFFIVSTGLLYHEFNYSFIG